MCTKEPLFRSNLYRLLSKGFRYPSPLMYKTFQNGEFFTELWDNISSLPHLEEIRVMKNRMFIKAEGNLKDITYEDFEVKFVETFDAGPICPPYEGFYRDEPRTAIMLEISEFYRYFGLVMRQEEDKREFPDHISAELEFIHFLTFKEAEILRNCKDENPNEYLLAQKDFLERHLIKWVPEFCRKLQKSPSAPFYALLAQITSMFIRCELEMLTANLHEFKAL